MLVFVLADRAWELRLGWTSPQGLCERGQARQGRRSVNWNTLKSWKCLSETKSLFKLLRGEAPPPRHTATARRQHRRRQDEERCWSFYRQPVCETLHVLRILPAVQQKLFDSTALLFPGQNTEGPKARWTSESGTSRLQSHPCVFFSYPIRGVNLSSLSFSEPCDPV